MKVLSGHVSPETAFVCPDYPYGFRLRCQIRYWIETKPGHGQRVVSQTTNPKREGIVWNKPKASTYTELRVLYVNDTTGHVENDGLSIYDTETAKIAAFEAAYGEGLQSEWDQSVLTRMKAIAKVYEARKEAHAAAV